MLKVAVIGTGYVGLSTGACLASLGHQVTCIDVDVAKIQGLNHGEVAIVEDGLNELVSAGLASSTLNFTSDVSSGLKDASVAFLCLPTPQGDDGRADLSYIMGVIPVLSTFLEHGAVLVNKSTVPVGTAGVVSNALGRPDVAVVSNPEFLRQGTAVHDFLHPTRIVVGGDDVAAIEKVASLYRNVDAPVLKMKTALAEALKYAANAFLATKLTFINAMADICEAVGADIFDVSTGIGMDLRIGADMLNAGPGWGGSCFPKDTRALVKIASDGGYDFALLRGVIETNDQHYARIAKKVIRACGGNVQGMTVAAWGLTFKAGTDDLRDSPSIKILTMLRDAGAKVQAFEPTARSSYEAFPWIEICGDEVAACSGADVLAVLTEWPQFRAVDPLSVYRQLKSPRIVDGRNVLDRSLWLAAGFEYLGVGR